MMKQPNMSQIHVCGACKGKFANEMDYLNHKCLSTGFTPQNQEHLGDAFIAVSKEAIKRGDDRKVAVKK